MPRINQMNIHKKQDVAQFRRVQWGGAKLPRSLSRSSLNIKLLDSVSSEAECLAAWRFSYSLMHWFSYSSHCVRKQCSGKILRSCTIVSDNSDKNIG